MSLFPTWFLTKPIGYEIDGKSFRLFLLACNNYSISNKVRFFNSSLVSCKSMNQELDLVSMINLWLCRGFHLKAIVIFHSTKPQTYLCYLIIRSWQTTFSSSNLNPNLWPFFIASIYSLSSSRNLITKHASLNVVCWILS